jgi:hypothetical protein|tara:strand:- start:971 stop:1285 length:315 start_codon:yes stop_codon:yes gene_type:complete
MRVKLSYTVDEADVMKEASKLVGLSGEEMQEIVNYFSQLQSELSGKEGEKPNPVQCLETIEEFRNALLKVDVRLSEVGEVVAAYADYQLRSHDPEEAPPAEEVP